MPSSVKFMNPFGGSGDGGQPAPVGTAGGLIAAPSGAMPATGAPNIPTATVDASKNCRPEYMSVTMDRIPATQSLLAKTCLPLGLCIQPMAEAPGLPDRPLVDFGQVGVIRCENCRAYINPFVEWLENGTQWQCNFCGNLNVTPSGYYCGLDSEGRRHDLAKRPELCTGSVEVVAPDEYMVRAPVAPAYVFVLDASFNAVQSGMLEAACEAILESLDNLPGGDRTQVAFLTYSTAVHFYSLRPSASAPAMHVVADIDDLFMPTSGEDLLVNLTEARPLVEALLETLPAMHANSKAADTCLGSALNAAYAIMQHLGGKMVVCLSHLPSQGAGKLQQREGPRMLGSDDEFKLLAPDVGVGGSFYRNRAVDFSRQQISVDVFMLGNQYTDVATIGSMARYTAGQAFFYPHYQGQVDAPRLQADLLHTLTRTTGFEAVMRVRVSAGLSISNFYGNFFIRGQDLLTLPNITPDTAFNVEMAHGAASLAPGAVVAVQGALLYTTADAQRRILVHTMAIPVTTLLSEVFSAANVDAVQNMIAKVALDTALRNGLPACRRYLHRVVVEVSRAYASSESPLGVPQPAAGGGVNLPESLQLLPLYSMALQKSIVYRGGSDISSDERAHLVYTMLTMPALKCRAYCYPRLFSLHDMEEGAGRPVPDGVDVDPDDVAGYSRIRLPATLHNTESALDAGGVYLLDDTVEMFLWVGSAAPSGLLQALFGVPSLAGANTAGLLLLPLENDYSTRVLAIVNALQESACPQQRLRVVCQGAGGYLESRFKYRMVEDGQNFTGGTLAYAEYLATVARETAAVGAGAPGGGNVPPPQAGPPSQSQPQHGAPVAGSMGGPPPSGAPPRQQVPPTAGSTPGFGGPPPMTGGPPAHGGPPTSGPPPVQGGPPPMQGGGPPMGGPPMGGPPTGGFGPPPSRR